MFDFFDHKCCNIILSSNCTCMVLKTSEHLRFNELNNVDLKLNLFSPRITSQLITNIEIVYPNTWIYSCMDIFGN